MLETNKILKKNLKGRHDVKHVTFIDHLTVIIDFIVIYKVIDYKDCGIRVVGNR